MATTPEGKVKRAVKEVLNKFGSRCHYFMPMTGGYGRSGEPDFICCIDGYFIAIETKSGNNKPTPLQEAMLHEIRFAGGTAMVVNEVTVKTLEEALNEVVEKNF